MAIKMQRDGQMEVTFEGAVLSTREYNGYHDSDFYATVWDDETGATREICYGTTRCGGGGSATIDATDEVLAKYAAFWVERQVKIMQADDLEAAKQIERGSEVTMNRTMNSRKVGKLEKGLTGRVFWVGPSDFGGDRAGVEFSDGRKHFLATCDLNVTVDETKLRSEENLREYVQPRSAHIVAGIKQRRKVLVAA